LLAVSNSTKLVISLSVGKLGQYLASLGGTNLIAQVLVYSSQALTKPSGLPDLLLGHADGCGHVGAVEHLGIVVHLDCLELAS
jgi:hypothetical protein